VEDLIQEHMAQANASPQEMQDDQEDVPPNDGESESPPPSREDSGESGTRLPDRTVDVGARISLRLPDAKRRPRAMLLGRDSSKAKSSLGRVVRHRQWDGHTIDIAPLATVVSAAPRLARGMIDGATALAIEPEDIRMRQRLARSGRLVLFLVDGSGSMGAQERMRVTKAAIMSLLQQRYEKRDKVAIQVFRDDRVELVLRPTSSIDEAARLLRTLPTGGRTPLAMALDEALAFIKKQHSISSYDDAMLVVITDGRSNDAGLQAAAQSVRESGLETFVIDAESGTVRLWRAKALAEMIGAVYLDLNEYERH
jgi:magnesium chelatase subunit D